MKESSNSDVSVF